jgi:hypothetical protein
MTVACRNYGRPVRGESRGEMRLREHGEFYRSPMTTPSKRIEQLRLFCLRTERYRIANRCQSPIAAPCSREKNGRLNGIAGRPSVGRFV